MSRAYFPTRDLTYFTSLASLLPFSAPLRFTRSLFPMFVPMDEPKHFIQGQPSLQSVYEGEDLRRAYPSVFYQPGTPGVISEKNRTVNTENSLFLLGTLFFNDSR